MLARECPPAFTELKAGLNWTRPTPELQQHDTDSAGGPYTVNLRISPKWVDHPHTAGLHYPVDPISLLDIW